MTGPPRGWAGGILEVGQRGTWQGRCNCLASLDAKFIVVEAASAGKVDVKVSNGNGMTVQKWMLRGHDMNASTVGAAAYLSEVSFV